MKELIQKRLLSQRSVKIKDDKLFFKHSRLGNETEFSFSHEDITGEKVSKKSGKIWLMICGILCALLGIWVVNRRLSGLTVGDYADIFWFVSGAAFIVAYFLTREVLWVLRLGNEGYIEIFKSVPSKQKVDDFIKDMMTERNNYLVKNYAQFDKNRNYENQYNNLKWLLRIDAIDKITFEKKENELQSLYGNDDRQIGFIRDK